MPWRRSSRSTSWRTPARSTGDGQCVEIGQGPQVIAVRDSKDPGGPVLRFTPGEWQAFLAIPR